MIFVVVRDRLGLRVEWEEVLAYFFAPDCPEPVSVLSVC